MKKMIEIDFRKGIVFVVALGYALSMHASQKNPAPAHGQDPVLPAGQYSARIKKVVCGGCGSVIEKTMSKIKGLENVTVDQKNSRVNFGVAKGALVPWSAIQAELKKSAANMGMGADYSLSDFQVALPAASQNSASSKQSLLSSGYYTANLAPLVCGGCKSLIEKTMLGVPGIGAANVDADKAIVLFTVMKGKSVSILDLENALNEAASRMGMGADYSLRNIEPKKPG